MLAQTFGTAYLEDGVWRASSSKKAGAKNAGSSALANNATKGRGILWNQSSRHPGLLVSRLSNSLEKTCRIDEKIGMCSRERSGWKPFASSGITMCNCPVSRVRSAPWWTFLRQPSKCYRACPHEVDEYFRTLAFCLTACANRCFQCKVHDLTMNSRGNSQDFPQFCGKLGLRRS